jgi:hypothetical protein
MCAAVSEEVSQQFLRRENMCWCHDLIHHLQRIHAISNMSNPASKLKNHIMVTHLKNNITIPSNVI